MTYQVPNAFVPQTQQPISSGQTDQNNDYITDALNSLQAQIGSTGGNVTETAKVTYLQRPVNGNNVVPAASEYVDRKWVEATRGCRVGDMIWAVMPNALPNDYGVEWGKFEGQQLSQTTYADMYAICQALTGVSPIAGQYNYATGASAGNFVMPDARGCAILPVLGVSNNLPTATVPNATNANNAGSVLGEGNHTQTLNELFAHTHTEISNNGLTYSVASGGSAGAMRSATPVASGSTGGGQAFNIVQRSFMAYLWVRIK